jgi:uncharacterized membrane protein
MNKKALECLYQELPAMVSAGVVPQEVAERIRLHYGELASEGGTAKRRAIILFSILGAVLIGGGIILLLAHNWEELSRPVRAAVSVMPLAISQAVGAWVLWTRRESIAWKEGVGAFQTMAIGAAIALVSQTYNLGGQFDEFMLTWALLALPLAYLLEASVPALFYLIAITVWAGSVTQYDGRGPWFFALLALALPFLWLTSRVDRHHPRPVLFGWVLAITGCIGAGITLEPASSPFHAWPLLFGGLFGLLFLAGSRWWAGGSTSWQRPLQNVGAIGALGLSLVLSFRDSWGHVARWNDSWSSFQTLNEKAGAAIGAVVFAAAVALWVWSWARRAWLEIMLGAVPALTLIGWALAKADSAFLAMILFNLYLVIFGLGTLVIGLRGRHLAVVNSGMFVLACVILCRFFDADIGFVLRGVAFILVGTGFLATNLVLLRWKGESK